MSLQNANNNSESKDQKKTQNTKMLGCDTFGAISSFYKKEEKYRGISKSNVVNHEFPVPIKTSHMIDFQYSFNPLGQTLKNDNNKDDDIKSAINLQSKIIEENVHFVKKESFIWNELCEKTLIGYKSCYTMRQIRPLIFETLNTFVEQGYIDWIEAKPFVIQGRIYTQNDNAEFRCEMYALIRNTNDDSSTVKKSVVALRRMFGNGWVYNEFRTLFLQSLSEKNCIAYDNVENNDKLENFLGEMELENEQNEAFEMNEAEKIVLDAVDCNQDRESFRENVLLLRRAMSDNNKIKSISQIKNVLTYLMKPIFGDQQIYDTWIIKTLLEIIIKLMQYGVSEKPSNLNSALRQIKQQWADYVQHPLGITTFYPSQQITRLICDDIIAQTVCYA